MTLHLHRAERADRLITALGAELSTPLPDPFATEIVAVPTPGVERWLSQSLARQLGASAGREDGVCTGIDFSSPRRLMARTLAGVFHDPDEVDPWQPHRAVWALLGVIDGCRGEPWAGLLWSSLGDGRNGTGEARGGRRWSTARHLADLFARYASARPAMVNNWRRGLDFDADDRPLPADRAWQAELWRRLRVELSCPGPAERIADAIDVLHGNPELDLPERLSVFGATRFDPDQLRVLAALAAHREVHFWLPHPSPGLWGRLAEEFDNAPAARRRVDDRSEGAVGHRLLAYLGRDSRELQLQLNATAAVVDDRYHPATTAPRATLLARLQADISADLGPRQAQDRPPLSATDTSVSFHASHGPDRQVEVLRELLVGLLADDPTLEPRDIVVMCPDIETFAPLIAAAFGLDTSDTEAEHPGHRLRVRLADRSLRQLNPLLAIVSRLVGLAEARMEATALLDLCATEPVARKFGFRVDDLERLHELVLAAGVRWGLDAGHRARYGMADFAQNTWAAGLDRLLLGVTMDETDEHFIGTALPMDDVDSADVDLVGRLAECVTRVKAVTDACGHRQTVSAWVELFKQALDLLTAVPPTDSWQLGHAYTELGRLAENAAPTQSGGPDVELSLPEVSALLADAFRGRPTRANFRTGTLTMCTMMPMRSVPHRVVCLLGLDDGVFPRRTRIDGDDITAMDEWLGDRDAHSEDRQLLLDAIMAAEDRLLVVYAGMDPRSGKPLPPAVPIAELLDALEVTARTVDGMPVREAITVTHPLQPFDERNFRPDRLTRDGQAFSFDRAALRGVRAARAERLAVSEQPSPRDPGGGPLLPPLGPEWTPTLESLLRFFVHPVRALLRERAQLSTWRPDDEPDEQIPVDLNGLDRWKIGDRLLRHHLQGLPLQVLSGAEWRRGSLPPRLFGQRALDDLTESVAELSAQAGPYLVGEPERHEVVADLGSERLTGGVPRVFGDDLVRVSFSKLSARQRLQSWIELLALAVSRPERPWRAVTIGTGGLSVLGPVPGTWARAALADLVDLQRTGLAEPLPFAAKTSAEYARVRHGDRQIEPYLPNLEKIWKLDRDQLYEQFFGGGVTVADLLRIPPVPGEERGSLGEPGRFGTLARRVFHLLLLSEELG